MDGCDVAASSEHTPRVATRAGETAGGTRCTGDFRKLCQEAGIGPALKGDGANRARAPKDLRDPFTSQLLTAGIQLGCVSHQLGHPDVSVTAGHYARWTGGDAYRSPLEFPASRMCTIEEIADTTAIPESLAGIAWLRGSRDCNGWISDVSGTLGDVATAQGTRGQAVNCASSQSIACCALVP